MSIWLYKKHPPHNLGGENYPHFRNESDKYYWVTTNLIDLSKKIELNITRVSFDTARLMLSCKKYQVDALKIAGIAEDRLKEKFYYWFVIGWSFGSNENVVILELKLDYWLTFWPLKFNKALVRVNRKHMRRFTQDSTKEQYNIEFNKTNRQLQIPERTTPPNILNYSDPSLKPSIVGDVHARFLMIGIVFTPVGGANNKEFSSNNFFIHLGDNRPGKQMGFLIFAKYNEPNINTWLSFPGITQTFYFFMNPHDINNVTYKVNTPGGGDYKFVGDYALDTATYDPPIKPWPKLDFELKLNAVSGRKPVELSNSFTDLYKPLIIFLIELTTLSRMDNTKPHKGSKITIDSNGKVFWDLASASINKIQLVSLKSFITASTASSKSDLVTNQPIRKWKNVYFTTINIFNKYMKYQQKYKKRYFYILFDWSEIFKKEEIKKNTPVKWLRKLKLWANFKYLFNFQNENQEIKPHLWKSSLSIVSQSIKYHFGWFLTTNNSYFIAEPDNKDLQPHNKKYNIVMANHTTLPNYTDGSLEFYQKQGVSYETGVNQAKYMLSWAKRYNQFQEREVPFEIFKGAVGNLAGNYFSGGLIAGSAGRYAGVAYGAVTTIGGGIFKEQEMKLQNEMREKKAFYALKNLQAKQEDIFNQPTTTHANDQVEISYQFISKKIWPSLVTMVPTDADLIAQAKLYHKFGNLNDQDEIVDLNDGWTRRCWNYWEIHNIEQAIIKDDLNHNVITFFNNLFNHGVRLWNVFFEEVKFNDYSLENWEQKMLENEK